MIKATSTILSTFVGNIAYTMELNYKVMGEGKPLIILHGLLGSLDNWQTIGRKLADSYQVHIIDERNHGRSPHTDTHSYPEMAADLLEFMDRHDIQTAHLLGHSMGGKTVMEFALAQPDRVLSLIVADMGIKAYEAKHDEIFNALFRIDLDAVERRSDAEEQIEALIDDNGVRQFLLKSLDRTTAGNYEWKFNLDVLHNDYPNMLKAVKSDTVLDKPVLFIRGGRSNYVKESDLEDFKKNFPQAQLETIDNAGHWLHAEAPKEFLEASTQFLRSVQ